MITVTALGAARWDILAAPGADHALDPLAGWMFWLTWNVLQLTSQVGQAGDPLTGLG